MTLMVYDDEIRNEKIETFSQSTIIMFNLVFDSFFFVHTQTCTVPIHDTNVTKKVKLSLAFFTQ